MVEPGQPPPGGRVEPLRQGGVWSDFGELAERTVRRRHLFPGFGMMLRSASRLRAFLPLFAGVFLSDCVSKRVAVERLTSANVPHDVVGDLLRFTLAYNQRAAMGLSAGSASRWILAAMVTAMLIGVVVWLVRTKSDNPVVFSGIALVAAGALGNLVDRERWDRGVVDFIDIGFGAARFWIFNVADAAITVGAVLLWLATRHAPSSGDPERPGRTTASVLITIAS